jgi:hypothetical protein
VGRSYTSIVYRRADGCYLISETLFPRGDWPGLISLFLWRKFFAIRSSYSVALQQEAARSMIPKDEILAAVPILPANLPPKAPVASVPSTDDAVEDAECLPIDLPIVKTIRAKVRYGGWLQPLPLDEDDFVEPCEEPPPLPLPVVRTIRAKVRRAGPIEPMPFEVE